MRSPVGAVTLATAAILAMLSLTGCVASGRPEVPAPPTIAEINERIPVVVVAILGTDRASASAGIFVECLNAAGDTTTEASLGGLDFRPLVISDDGSRRESIQACRVVAPAAGITAYLFSDAQVDYLYEYVETSLRPCLASLGIFPPPTPPRDDFSTEFGAVWSPYDHLTGSGATSTRALEDVCPRFPVPLAF